MERKIDSPLFGADAFLAIRGREQSSIPGAFLNKPGSIDPVIYEIGSQSDRTHIGRTSEYRTNMQLQQDHRLQFPDAAVEELTRIYAPAPMLEDSRGKLDRLTEENGPQSGALEGLDSCDDLDQVLLDLIKTQEKMREKEIELARKEVEVQELLQQVSKLSAKQEETMVIPRNESELLGLQQRVSELTADLEEKEKCIRRKDEQLAEWERHLQAALQQFETQRREQDEKLKAEIAEERKLREESEARLQEVQVKQRSLEHQDENRHLKEMKDVAVVETEGRETGRTLQASEVGKLRSLLDFFKDHSERLSNQNREVMDENRRLQEAIISKDQELKEQASMIKRAGRLD
jgi:hypothetical protein